MLLIVCVLVGVGGLGLLGCSSDPQPVSVSYSPFEPTALALIAEDQGFFRANGLAATFHKYPTGPAALDAMLNGEADVAVGIGEFPMVGRAFKQTQGRVIASADRSELISIVARKDAGIAEAADLKGKRVGTTRGTIAEFFLGRFLELHGLSSGDITLVDLETPDEWINAVGDNDVDAVATAEPYATQAAQRLGTNAAVWSAHNGQPSYGLVVVREEWLGAHPELSEMFLRALAQAEDYAAQNPVEAQPIVSKALGLDPGSTEAVWQRNQFSLTLDQSLIAAMEDEARWLIGHDLTEATAVPDFPSFVSEAGLQRVRPEAVNILRSSPE